MELSFEDDLTAALDDLRAAREELALLVREVPDGRLKAARPGGWSVRRTIEHVLESDTAYCQLVHRLRERTAPARDVPAASFSSGVDAARLLQESLGAIVLAVEGVDAEALYRLTALGHEEYSVLSVLENVAAHDRDHRGQIERALGDLRGPSG